MVVRKKIGIFIDYSIRVPAFKQAYELFKQAIFHVDGDVNVDEDSEITGVNDKRFFWQRELMKQEVANFYLAKHADKIDNVTIKGNFLPWFYSQEHMSVFLEDYTYNLYADADVPCKHDLHLINICQARLFDVVLFDRYNSVRKIGNTFHFLAKTRVYPRQVFFLKEEDQIKEEDYLGIWNPALNSEQINKDKSGVFLKWFQDLEEKYNQTQIEINDKGITI